MHLGLEIEELNVADLLLVLQRFIGRFVVLHALLKVVHGFLRAHVRVVRTARDLLRNVHVDHGLVRADALHKHHVHAHLVGLGELSERVQQHLTPRSSGVGGVKHRDFAALAGAVAQEPLLHLLERYPRQLFALFLGLGVVRVEERVVLHAGALGSAHLADVEHPALHALPAHELGQLLGDERLAARRQPDHDQNELVGRGREQLALRDRALLLQHAAHRVGRRQRLRSAERGLALGERDLGDRDGRGGRRGRGGRGTAVAIHGGHDWQSDRRSLRAAADHPVSCRPRSYFCTAVQHSATHCTVRAPWSLLPGESGTRATGADKVARRYACLLFFVTQRTALTRFCALGSTAKGRKGRAKVTQK